MSSASAIGDRQMFPVQITTIESVASLFTSTYLRPDVCDTHGARRSGGRPNVSPLVHTGPVRLPRLLARLLPEPESPEELAGSEGWEYLYW